MAACGQNSSRVVGQPHHHLQIVWWVATFREWQSSVCACWILDLGPGCHIAYLGPAFSWENVDWQFWFCCTRSSWVRTLFWFVASIECLISQTSESYGFKRKDGCEFDMGCEKQRAKPVLSCMASKANPTPVNSTWDRIEEWMRWAFNYRVGHRGLAFIVQMEFQLKAPISNWKQFVMPGCLRRRTSCVPNVYGLYVGSGHLTHKFLPIPTGSQCQSYQISPQTSDNGFCFSNTSKIKDIQFQPAWLSH